MNNKYGLFYSLLAKMPGVSKEELVSQYSGGTSLSELYERAPKTYRRMIDDMKKVTTDECDDKRMDMMRKRVIASINGYIEKAGLYMGLNKREKLQKIIAIGCRSAGVTDFNDMTEPQMRRVYNEFLRKQQTAERTERIMDQEKNVKDRVIRRGTMSVIIKERN